MQPLFITATNTDVGKTYACEKFLHYFAKQGKKVGYFKPCETGVKEFPLDGDKMLKCVQQLNPTFKATIHDVVPYQFELPAAPYVAKKETIISMDLLIEKKNFLQSMCDILIIEGAGGVMVPIEKEVYMIDLITLFDAKAVLITPSKLGCINDTLLSMEALKNRNIPFDWYINLFTHKEHFDAVSKPFLEEKFGLLHFLEELEN